MSWASHQSWSDPTNWDCNGANRVPGTNDTVEITVNSPITLDRNATVQSITVDNHGVLNTDNNNRVLTLTANTPFTVSSGGTFTAGNSTVVINRNGNTTLTSGNIAFNNLQLVPSLSDNRTYTFGAGTIAINGDFDIKPTGSSGSLTVNMASSITVGRTTTIQPGNGNVNAVLNTMSSANSLTSGRLVVGSNGTLTANGSAIVLNGSIDPLFTLNGIFNRGTSTVIMGGSKSLTLTSGAINFSNLTINMPGRTGTLGASVTVDNTLTLSNGTLAVGANTLTLNGPAIAGTPSNLATTSSSDLYFGGSSSGVSIPASVTALRDLKIDNAKGVSLNGSVAVNRTLILANGALVTGPGKVAATANCNAGSVNATNGYVDGNLQLTFPSGSGIACAYRVGNGGGNTSMTVTINSTGGTLTGSTTASEHPQIAASSIDPTRDANRYWSLWQSGDSIAPTGYGVALNFISADLDAGATPANFVVGKYASSAWTMPAPVSAAGSSASVSGLAGPINAPIDFALGEVGASCPVPAGLPNTMTCVCDNFGRTTLNPSTIYGGNWQLSTSGGTFGVPKIVTSGFLRMTDRGNDIATAATMPGVFPAAGNLITVEFKHYAYNGSGADGMALTLSDATVPVTPGAYGGSLGYAQKNNASCSTPPCNGFAGGWIGIGIDEFGNYSAATEGRSGGPGVRQDAVAIRGSGSGLTGYPYLAGTSSLSPGIDNLDSGNPAYGHAYRIMVDARNYTVTNKTTLVTVNRDTSGAGNFNAGNQIFNFDAYAVNPAQAPVPQNWKLSFTGSTGASTNIHELAAVRVCAQTIVPPAGYQIEVDNQTPSTCTSDDSGKPIVTITALDSNGKKVTTYDKTVTLSAALSGGATSNATWSKYAANGVLNGNQYTFTAADNGVARFYLTDGSQQDVYISVTENGGAISSSLGTPVKYRGSSFSIAGGDALGLDVVAGRPHLMTVTRNNACAKDTSYSGTKNLDGWYTAAADHPSGADAPQLCAPNASGTCLSATGACTTLPAVQPGTSSTSNNLPALTFSNGSAKFCLATSDVGKYAVSMRDDANVSAPVAGSSKALTVRPFAVVVSNLAAGGNANPAGNGPNGNVFTSAGSDFAATIGAYRWNSAGDANGDGLPDAGASLPALTGGGLASHYADTVVLAPDTSPASFTPPSPPGNPGSLANGNVAVSAGAATASALSYSEVGSFTLKATPSANYLNSPGVDLAPRVAIFANNASAQQERWVGRFTPHHFGLSGGTLANRSELSCSGSTFTYMGEPMNAGFMLTALDRSGNTTLNYSGAYAKFDNAVNWTGYGAQNSLGLWMLATNVAVSMDTCKAMFSSAGSGTTSFVCPVLPPPAPITRAAGPRVTVSPVPAAPSMIWSNGVGTFAANVVLERADAPDGAYDSLLVGIAPKDNDGIGLLSTALDMDADNDGTNERAKLGNPAKVRYGRLRIANAYGSELLPMPVTVQAQYWNGGKYVTNVDDGCTPLAAANFSVAQAAGASIGTQPSGTGQLAGGSGRIMLTKPAPTPAGKGAVTLSSTIPYLPGSGRQTFGVYNGGPILYLRELHY